MKVQEGTCVSALEKIMGNGTFKQWMVFSKEPRMKRSVKNALKFHSKHQMRPDTMLYLVSVVL